MTRGEFFLPAWRSTVKRQRTQTKKPSRKSKDFLRMHHHSDNTVRIRKLRGFKVNLFRKSVRKTIGNLIRKLIHSTLKPPNAGSHHHQSYVPHAACDTDMSSSL